MEKFWHLKMDTSSFNHFYSQFIHLVLDLEYILKILFSKFKYKLMPNIQYQQNSRLKLLTSISVLVKHYLSIYKQIQATNQTNKQIKSQAT